MLATGIEPGTLLGYESNDLPIEPESITSFDATNSYLKQYYIRPELTAVRFDVTTHNRRQSLGKVKSSSNFKSLTYRSQ